MSQDKAGAIPVSPETQSAEVREELDQEMISHRGVKLPPSRDRSDAQRHMGAMEDNVTPVIPPAVGPASVTAAGDEDHDVSTHSELTPG